VFGHEEAEGRNKVKSKKAKCKTTEEKSKFKESAENPTFLLIQVGDYDIRDNTRWLEWLEKCRWRFELHSSKVGGQF
jgi:hypothetical protein